MADAYICFRLTAAVQSWQACDRCCRHRSLGISLAECLQYLSKLPISDVGVRDPLGARRRLTQRQLSQAARWHQGTAGVTDERARELQSPPEI